MYQTPSLNQLPEQDFNQWQDYVNKTLPSILSTKGKDLSQLKGISVIPWHHLITPITLSTHTIAVVRVDLENPTESFFIFCKLTSTESEALVEAKGYQILENTIPGHTIKCLYPEITLDIDSIQVESENYGVVITEFEPRLQSLSTIPDLFTSNIRLFDDTLVLLAKLHSQNTFHGDLWLRNVANNAGVVILFDAYSVIDITSQPSALEDNKFKTYFEQARSITAQYFSDPSLREICILYEIYMMVNSREVQELIHSSEPETVSTIRNNFAESFVTNYITSLEASDVDKDKLQAATIRLIEDFLRTQS